MQRLILKCSLKIKFGCVQNICNKSVTKLFLKICQHSPLVPGYEKHKHWSLHVMEMAVVVFHSLSVILFTPVGNNSYHYSFPFLNYTIPDNAYTIFWKERIHSLRSQLSACNNLCHNRLQ